MSSFGHELWLKYMEMIKMAENAVYVSVTLFLLTLLIAKLIGQRFFNRSLRAKSINPSDECRVQWQFVFLMGICGLLGGISISLVQAMNPGAYTGAIELLCATILSTICFSILAWIGFRMIGAILRARIKSGIEKSTENTKSNWS